MPIEKSDLLQGTLDMLILKIVELARCTVTGSPSESGRSPRKYCRLQQGSLYPALHRLEKRGWWPRSGASPTTGGRPSFTSCRRRPQATGERGIELEPGQGPWATFFRRPNRSSYVLWKSLFRKRALEAQLDTSFAFISTSSRMITSPRECS